MRRPLLVSALLAIVASACSPGFPPESIIEKNRPLAGRVSVIGDETRATPAPGESARYDFLVASPGAQVPYSYLLVACPIERTPLGVAICNVTSAADLWGLEEQTSPTATFELPSITFAVPDANTLGDATEGLVFGAICPGGDLDPALVTALMQADTEALTSIANPCADKTANGLLVTSPFPIERASTDVNHTPLATGVAITNDPVRPPGQGTAFTSEADPTATNKGCLGTSTYQQVTAGSSMVGFIFTLDPSAREMYEKPSAIAGQPPTLTTEVPYVRGYASGGHFGVLLDNQQEAGQLLELTWTPPVDADMTGTLVRFWFLVRDDRQGDLRATSWLERAICVVPTS